MALWSQGLTVLSSGLSYPKGLDFPFPSEHSSWLIVPVPSGIARKKDAEQVLEMLLQGPSSKDPRPPLNSRSFQSVVDLILEIEYRDLIFTKVTQNFTELTTQNRPGSLDSHHLHGTHHVLSPLDPLHFIWTSYTSGLPRWH